MAGKYYDGTKLLSLSDINGEKPEIYICTTNRTGGKTTFFGRYVVNRFLKNGEKFMLMYRYSYELDNVAEKFFKDIHELFFKDWVMSAKKVGKGSFVELFLDPVDSEDSVGNPCGYAVALNNADTIKKYSHYFSDTQRIIFDEFQSETNRYCPNEVAKFLSIHTSVARGQGEQVRYVPVYMLSNPVTLINPYYVEMGITTRLQENTKFLRGDGYVLEQGNVESASEAQKLSGVNRAFADNRYTQYSAESVYLNDSRTFIEKPSGKSKYVCTLKYKGVEFALREYAEIGILYCDDRPDVTCKFKIAVTTEDHNVNYVMLRKFDEFIAMLRYFFEKGCFRFKDIRCKEALLTVISY